jgi:hypothetical protein
LTISSRWTPPFAVLLAAQTLAFLSNLWLIFVYDPSPQGFPKNLNKNLTGKTFTSSDRGTAAVAELERSLFVERVEAGLRNARAKGKKLGRPRVKVDEFRVQALRDSGASWRAIARRLNLTLGTVLRASQRSGELGSQATSRVGQEVLCA